MENQPPLYSMQPTPTKEPANVLAILSLVFGILSLLCCCWWIVSVIFGATAIILAIFSKKDGKLSGIAIGGLVCGIIGCVIHLIFLILGLVFTTSEFFGEFWKALEWEFDNI